MTESEEQDPILERAIAELRRLPAVPPDTVARVARVATTAGAGAEPPTYASQVAGRRWMRVAAYVGLAAAAVLVGYVARGARSPAHQPAPAAAVPAAQSVVPVADGSDADARPLPQQFVFHSRTAKRVALVGDFNGWNPRATPLARTPASALWSVTIPILPGRHGYAFMIDDSLFALDPRAPVIRDPDLGTRSSVVVVGRP